MKSDKELIAEIIFLIKSGITIKDQIRKVLNIGTTKMIRLISVVESMGYSFGTNRLDLSIVLPKIIELIGLNKNLAEISDILNLKYATVRSICRRNSISCADGRSMPRKQPKKDHPNISEICEDYISGLSMKDVGIKWNLSVPTVFGILKSRSVKSRLKSGKTEYRQPKLDKFTLENLYNIENYSLYMIYEKYQDVYRNHGDVYRDMLFYDIPLRDYKSSGKISYTHQDRYDKMIVANRKTLLNNRRSGPTDIELMFATWCMENDINYEFQYVIDGEETEHAYDFYLPDFNLIVETDGEYWHETPIAKMKDEIFEESARRFGYHLIRLKRKPMLEFGDNYIRERLGEYV